MKKSILLLALALISVTCLAQAKKTADTAKVKPVYKKFMAVPLDEYSELLQKAHQYRDVIIYKPWPKDKTNIQSNTDYFLEVTLPATVRLDSIQVNTGNKK